jgi:SAM-dependent methyltransferase
MLHSSLCRQRDFTAPWYNKWRTEIAQGAPELEADRQAAWGPVWQGMQNKWLHRKLWEWCAIAQALDERGLLTPTTTGLGFAVGREPLASLFAQRGCRLVATDFPQSDQGSNWSKTGQLAASLDAIHWPKLIGEPDFTDRVTYQPVDMRDLRNLPTAHFDFLWSSCSFEHLGSLNKGLDFVRHSLQCLKPGGVAVHTTEYNVSSNEQTVKTGDSVIYRRQDIEALDRSLRPIGCAIEALDFEAGSDPHDIGFDYPPYYSHGRQHIKLNLHDHISTSLLLIIRKAC